MEDPLRAAEVDDHLVVLEFSSVLGVVALSPTADVIVGKTATADLSILRRPDPGPRGDVLAVRCGQLVPLAPVLTVDGAPAPVGVPVSPRTDLRLPRQGLRFRIVPAAAVRAFAEHHGRVDLCWALGQWVPPEQALALARENPDMRKVGCPSLPLFASDAHGLRVLADGGLVAVSRDADGVMAVLRAARDGSEALSLAELGVALSTVLPMHIADVTEFRVTTVLRIVVDRAAEQVRIDTSWTGNCAISLGLRGVTERVWATPGSSGDDAPPHHR